MRRNGSFNVHVLIGALALAVVGSGALRLLMTGGISTSKKVQVTFWNGFTGPDGIVMLGIIDRFNQANPDVHVSMQRIPWGTYYNKLTVAGSDGRGPSLFVVHADALPRIRRAGFIDDATDVFEGAQAIDPKDFDGYVLNRVKFRGRFAGIPLDIHPQGLYCNADMLRAAGFVDKDGHARVPRTKVEFLRALDLMTHESSGIQTDKHWGFALTNWGANFRSLLPQFGGRYFDQKGNSVFDCPENVRALTFMSQLSKANKVPPPSNGLGWFGYRQQKVAMVWDGVFMLGDLKRLNTFKYIGAPIPIIGDHLGTLANSHVMCIRKGLSPESRSAVVRFARYVSNHSLDWADAGQVPARLSARKDPRFAAMPVQHAFAEQVPWMEYPPKTPLIFELMLVLDLAAEKAVRLQSTPEAALSEANKSAQVIIERDRVEHPEDQGA